MPVVSWSPWYQGSHLNLRPETWQVYFKPVFFLSHVVVMEEGQERDSSPDEQRDIIDDDDDMEDSPTDTTSLDAREKRGRGT